MAPTATAFHPPGPGAWELESTHWSRPATKFVQDAFQIGFAEGFRSGSARYGLMLSHFEAAYVNEFTYIRPIGFGAPKNAMGPPPKVVLQLMTRVVPKMRQRIQTSHDAIANKIWRRDLERWDSEVKPAAIARHRALQSLDLGAMDDAALARHVHEAHTHLTDMVRQHHEFTITACLPIGDFLAHVHDWTGKPPGEILMVLRGTSKISLGVAQEDLRVLAAAIKASPSALAILNGPGPASTIVDALTTHETAAGAMNAYLDLVSIRCLGYDLGSKSVGEMPELIVRSIAAAVDGLGSQKDTHDDAAARIAKLRGAVPAEHHAAFDALVAEVQLINRLRDERGHYSDGWAIGIARRALGEAGRRLVARGRLSNVDQVFEASEDEVIAMLGGQTGPGEDTLNARAAWRTTKTTGDVDVPPWLGAPPAPPPPAEWLPEKGRRSARAIAMFMGSLFVEPEFKGTETSVKGLPVSPGSYEGVARLVSEEADFGRIQRGDVLIARSTSPYFNVVLPLLGAIVTDRGGQLCHAAIVAREYGIPGVVGTREATKVVRDGDRVRVDGSTGEVTVLA
jgi:rifampicin phosphotransferase